jgi:threonine dehydrogenase-like Zn-dependent dehydrogenase
MSRLNASVRLLGRDERRLELASKWGIKHRLEGEAGRRADQDVVIDCTGTSDGFAVALQMVRPRGKIVIKAPLLPVAAGGPLIDAAAIAQHEIEVIGSRCGQISEAAAVLARGDVDVISLISSRDKLDRGAEALRAASKSDALAVVLEV